MKQVFFYILFGLFSVSLNATDKAKTTVQQTLRTHTPSVTAKASARLKDIDVTNPLFIFK
jgi:hypothetical protein